MVSVPPRLVFLFGYLSEKFASSDRGLFTIAMGTTCPALITTLKIACCSWYMSAFGFSLNVIMLVVYKTWRYLLSNLISVFLGRLGYLLSIFGVSRPKEFSCCKSDLLVILMIYNSSDYYLACQCFSSHVDTRTVYSFSCDCTRDQIQG